MSQETRHAELRVKTQQLLHGALKHVRAAALAAALVPLGAVAVSPAVAQQDCSGSAPPPDCVSVPEPVTSILVGVGAGAVGMAAWWKRRGKK